VQRKQNFALVHTYPAEVSPSLQELNLNCIGTCCDSCIELREKKDGK